MKATATASNRSRASAQADELASLPRRSLLHLPRQRRSARRVHDILDAAMEVLIASGSGGFNTNRVAEQAGVSVGSVYQYFPNKQAILGGIIERGLLDSEHLLRSVADQGLGRPFAEVVEEGLQGLTALLLPHRALMRELFREATPFSADSVLAPIEETLMDVARDWMLSHADAMRLAHGPATLYVGLRGGIFLFLRWIVEQPAGVPRSDFLPSLAEHVAAGIRPR